MTRCSLGLIGSADDNIRRRQGRVGVAPGRQLLAAYVARLAMKRNRSWIHGLAGACQHRQRLVAVSYTHLYVVFQVKATDRDPKIVFGMDRDGTGGVWFALQ